MINTIAQVDYLASAGRSPWHRASALSKLAFAAGAVSLAVFAPGLPLQLALYVAALALAVDRILDDHAMARRFGAAAVQHAARFGIDACAQAYSDVYDELGRAWQAPVARRGAR